MLGNRTGGPAAPGIVPIPLEALRSSMAKPADQLSNSASDMKGAAADLRLAATDIRGAIQQALGAGGGSGSNGLPPSPGNPNGSTL